MLLKTGFSYSTAGKLWLVLLRRLLWDRQSFYLMRTTAGGAFSQAIVLLLLLVLSLRCQALVTVGTLRACIPSSAREGVVALHSHHSLSAPKVCCRVLQQWHFVVFYLLYGVTSYGLNNVSGRGSSRPNQRAVPWAGEGEGEVMINQFSFSLAYFPKCLKITSVHWVGRSIPIAL